MCSRARCRNADDTSGHRSEPMAAASLFVAPAKAGVHVVIPASEPGLRPSRPASAVQTERCRGRPPRDSRLYAPPGSGMGPRLRGCEEIGFVGFCARGPRPSRRPGLDPGPISDRLRLPQPFEKGLDRLGRTRAPGMGPGSSPTGFTHLCPVARRCVTPTVAPAPEPGPSLGSHGSPGGPACSSPAAAASEVRDGSPPSRGRRKGGESPRSKDSRRAADKPE